MNGSKRSFPLVAGLLSTLSVLLVSGGSIEAQPTERYEKAVNRAKDIGKNLDLQETKKAEDLAQNLDQARREVERARAEAEALRAQVERERERAAQAVREAIAQRDAAQQAEARARQEAERALAEQAAARKDAEVARYAAELQAAQQAIARQQEAAAARQQAFARQKEEEARATAGSVDADSARARDQLQRHFAMKRQELMAQLKRLNDEQEKMLRELQQKAQMMREREGRQGAPSDGGRASKLDQVLDRLQRIEMRLERLESSQPGAPRKLTPSIPGAP